VCVWGGGGQDSAICYMNVHVSFERWEIREAFQNASRISPEGLSKPCQRFAVSVLWPCANLAGTLPSSLSRLASLVELRACGTSLRGSMPSALYTRPALTLAATITECGLVCEAGYDESALMHALMLPTV
jgi:hypothetical protein